MSQPAAFLLADGSRFDGEGLGTQGVALGEAVFYTGMTGYEEALTDPSYAGQILSFTYPLIGNYGVSETAMQYPRACVAGAVMKHICRTPSHYASKIDLPGWLDEQRVPTLVGVDTRSLTIALREHGTIAAALAVGAEALATRGGAARGLRARPRPRRAWSPASATRRSTATRRASTGRRTSSSSTAA